MNNLKFSKVFLFLLILFFYNNIISQTNSNINFTDSVPKEVKAYFDYLSSYNSYEEMNSKFENIELDKLKHSAKLLYEAFEINPLAARKQRRLLFDSLEAIIKKGEKNLSKFQLRLSTETRLFEKIKNQLKSVFPLVDCDYLFKVSILSSNVVKYISYSNPKLVLPKVDTKAIINEIFKGGTIFNVGDTITFYYFPFWIETKFENIVEGETYLLPIQLTGRYYENLAIMCPGGTCRIFPINSDQFLDSENYFNFGYKNPWEIARRQIIQQIKEIKSW